MTSPEAIVRSYYDALNARDFVRAAGPFSEGCEWVSMPTGNLFQGSTAVVAGLREFAAAFPDLRVDVERVIVSGNLVVVEWRTSGTFEKPFRAREPNGKRFERRGCAIAEIEQGRIVRYRDYFDRASLYAQLGLLDMFVP